MSNFSEKLKELCDSKNLTITELAKKSGVKPELLQDIVSGKNTNPGLITFLQICVALDISPDVLC